ncbi:MAG: hypothetical protein IPH07_31245 [Deltaproteobacteria bacterium]|nr:hypothetical protein [Deltaproteobacteria bacterium]MBK8234648.1 hypothetical protein [Deltaproteobacteria bacterium]MBK8715391.1 hypothetical protein [Deltaproteobacteria bacterium]MBP7287722.1 hypothetical protein [Nannocystaceae bacterium]
MRLTALLTISLVLACGKTGETNDESSSSSGSTTDGMGTSATMTSTTATTSATGMTDSATTTASTTDGTTTTTDATTTAADSSGTTDATGSGSSGGGSSGGSSSGGGGPVAYGPCDYSDPENPACPEGESCHELPGGEHWCSADCMDNADACPATESGTSVVECSNFYMACALNCAGDAACPDGMECVMINPQISRCGWPPA